MNANMLMLPMVIMTMEDEDNREYMTRLYRDYQALMLKTAWEYPYDQITVEWLGNDTVVIRNPYASEKETELSIYRNEYFVGR